MNRPLGWIKENKRTSILFVVMLILWAVMICVYFGQKNQPQNRQSQPEQKPTDTVPDLTQTEPSLETTEVMNGLSRPWDIVFLPDDTLLFNERGGTVSKIVAGQKIVIAQPKDIYAVGEGGLTGLALDSDFSENRYIYTCMNSQSSGLVDVRLVRWRLDDSATALEDRKDIITGIPSNRSGRHSGCRVRSASDGSLWVGTGDAAIAANPQSPQNLGGKILRVNREGMPVDGNLKSPYDPRIFSYGHRNVQGIVLFDNPDGDIYGYSVEHGSDRDDEVNVLRTGNFGWAPRSPYVETGVPMTDLIKFPEAVSAVWSSGLPTIAPSGAVLLQGSRWGSWQNAVAVAVLKGKQVRIFSFDPSHKLVSEKAILTQFGRIRSVTLSPDGSMYITTDNGSNDKIIKVVTAP